MFLSTNNYKLKMETGIQKYILENFNNYKSIHNEIEDMIDFNIKSLQVNTTGLMFRQYGVDKFIIFNNDSTKLYTTVNAIAGIHEIGSSDLVKSLFGVKIEGKWYIYLGQYNLIALREGYKYNKYEPFTWDELSYVAHEQMFGRYVSLDWKGNLKVDVEKLEADVNPRHMCGTDFMNEETPEIGLIKCYDDLISKKIDSTQLAQIKEDMIAGKDKIKDPVEGPTIAQKYLGIGVPIFESKAWKKFIQSKNQKK